MVIVRDWSLESSANEKGWPPADGHQSGLHPDGFDDCYLHAIMKRIIGVEAPE